MSFSQVVMYIIVIFMLAAAFDKITMGRFHLELKESFDEGIESMGPLALSVIGMLSLAPAMKGAVLKAVGPIYGLVGADPAMVAGAFLSSDTGGYALACELTEDYRVACFSGLILASIFGAVISFTIPIALGIIKEADRPLFFKGVLFGIIATPVGNILGGLAAGYPIGLAATNTIPTIVIALLLGIGVKFFSAKMIKGFDIFGKAIVTIIMIGLVAAIVEQETGIVVIKGMAPISEGFELVGTLAIFLAGAFPMLKVLSKLLNKPLKKAGAILKVNEAAVLGFIACLANVIPMLSLMKDMDERGKVINSAFAVSGAFILGDHMAFTASIDKELLLPMLIAKGTAGLIAVILAVIATRNITGEANTEAGRVQQSA